VFHFGKSALWIGVASLSVGAVAALGISSAQGSGLAVAPHGSPPPLPCEHFVYDGVAQPTVPGCVELGPAPLWSPPLGAVGPNGTVVTTAIVGPDTCCGFTAYTLHGKPLTQSTVDYLRLPDGQVRLFTPDIGQIQTGIPSAAATSMAAKLRVQPVPGEMDVTPAPLGAYPITPNDNSLGWTKATGP